MEKHPRKRHGQLGKLGYVGVFAKAEEQPNRGGFSGNSILVSWCKF